MSLPLDDLTLDELRPLLVAALLPHVAFDGWSPTALAAAAADLGIPADRARLVFQHGAIDMVAAWCQWADGQMLAALAERGISSLKIRERVTLAVRTRLEQALPHKEAVRRAVSVLAMPQHARRALRLTWGTVDTMWRACGDTATDYNHYTKRGILSGVYTATLLAWLNDTSDDHADTWAFLDRRIAGIMTFEKTKARVLGLRENMPSLTRFLGRLRYPAV
jgi:ubiquinone biosynthesis protein COQ9